APIRDGGSGQPVEVTVNVSFPEDYRATKVRIGGRISNTPNAKVLGDYWGNVIEINPDETFVSTSFAVKTQDYAARSITAGFMADGGAVGEARLRVEITPSPAKMRAWRSSVWEQLRAAALARYNEKRETLRAQRSALLSELEAPDTLSLRRMEREQ